MHPALSACHPHGACPGLFVLTVYAQADSSSCSRLCQSVNLTVCARADSSSWPQGTPVSRGRRGAPAVPPVPLYRLYRLPSHAAPVCCWSQDHRWPAAEGKGSRGSMSERRGPVTGREETIRADVADIGSLYMGHVWLPQSWVTCMAGGSLNRTGGPGSTGGSLAAGEEGPAGQQYRKEPPPVQRGREGPSSHYTKGPPPRAGRRHIFCPGNPHPPAPPITTRTFSWLNSTGVPGCSASTNVAG